MHLTNNIRVRNAHSSHSASPIRLSCPQCDRTFSSNWGRTQHIRAIHPLSTKDPNPDDVSFNHEPSPSPLNTSPYPHSLSPFVEVPSPIDRSSPSGSSASSSLPSCVFSGPTHAEQKPSSQNYRVTVEDVTDDEDEDAFPYRRPPSSHYSDYNHFDFGEEPSSVDSSPRHETRSVHGSKPKITRTYHPDLTGKFLFALLSNLI